MAEPDYKRPFAAEDFRGYFTWTPALTAALGGDDAVFYHACHEDELREFLGQGFLGLRSIWTLELPQFGRWDAPCSWCGLNDFAALGNYYGPFRIAFPLSKLEGRTFMSFRRLGDDRPRYFFVQYEARIPIFEVDGKVWRKVDPKKYFEDAESGLAPKVKAIYDIVVTMPVDLAGCRVESVKHPKCLAKKCKSMDGDDSRKALRAVSEEAILRGLQALPGYDALMSRFPEMRGRKVALWRAQDE